jgi:hypothetical protein
VAVEADGFFEFGEGRVLLELLPALFGVGEASHVANDILSITR